VGIGVCEGDGEGDGLADGGGLDGLGWVELVGEEPGGVPVNPKRPIASASAATIRTAIMAAATMLRPNRDAPATGRGDDGVTGAALAGEIGGSGTIGAAAVVAFGSGEPRHTG
jgi:hypothetical protein